MFKKKSICEGGVRFLVQDGRAGGHLHEIMDKKPMAPSDLLFVLRTHLSIGQLVGRSVSRSPLCMCYNVNLSLSEETRPARQ